jgi:hypothetical protein
MGWKVHPNLAVVIDRHERKRGVHLWIHTVRFSPNSAESAPNNAAPRRRADSTPILRPPESNGLHVEDRRQVAHIVKNKIVLVCRRGF